MNNIITDLNSAYQGRGAGFAFSSAALLDIIFEEIQELIFAYIKTKVTNGTNDERFSVGYLNPEWHIMNIGLNKYKVGVYVQNSTSELIIDINLLGIEKPAHKMPKIHLTTPGKIKGVRLNINPQLNIDNDECEDLIKKYMEGVYRNMIGGFETNMEELVIKSQCEDLYRVLRYSSIPTAVQDEISLYGVFEGMGRHLPSIARVRSIVSRMAKDYYNTHNCPVLQSQLFFLGALDGTKYELYTQKAFRSKTILTAKSQEYTGVCDAKSPKLATQIFWQDKELRIAPLVESSDSKCLLSAILPAWCGTDIEIELLRLAPKLEQVLQRPGKHSRDYMSIMNDLNKNTRKPNELASFLGTLGGSLIGAFTNANIDK